MNLGLVYSVLMDSFRNWYFTVTSFSILHFEDRNTGVKKTITAAPPTFRYDRSYLMSLLSSRLVFNVFSQVETKMQLDTTNRR